MNKQYVFERNLLSLSVAHPDLCNRLSAAETSFGNYTFLESRLGELIPAITDNSGKAHPLHSMIDPVKEGSRLLHTIDDAGFLIILGLGGAFHITAALARKDILKIIIIDFNINGIAELFASKEYVEIFKDKRVSFMIDPPVSCIEDFVVNNYNPALFGGISVLPLRTRTDLDVEKFNAACDEIKLAIDRISGDFSVQSLFGKRWFSNIIRNLKSAEHKTCFIPTIHHVAIIAAGPSLDLQLSHLEKNRSLLYVISTDTAAPALLERGIIPDAIISMDCQHFSLYHFTGTRLQNIPLFLDMASPSAITALSDQVHFFTSGHPFSQYITQYWKHLPFIDTSGGNVTYTALSLADSLGAKKIDLYGLDFSYSKGNVYAKGTYIHKLFAHKQNRFSQSESQFNHFLYRNTSLEKVETEQTWYYQTRMLKDYRGHFERKLASLSSQIHQIEGIGISLNVQKNNFVQSGNIIFPLSSGIASVSAEDFLAQYYDDIKKISSEKDLSLVLENTENALAKETHLVMTLLPLFASFKKEFPDKDIFTIFEMTKYFVLNNIEKVFSSELPSTFVS
ncbi:MAG: DUF115 domain-containing protein [Treponema sp.]|jgi:hypothetical protein|nr:DUF115 domain-containing protein [Treponema sp.]